MTTPEPYPADPSPLRTPPGVPEGSFLALPQPTQPGEEIPPIPCVFAVGLTNPDVKGHRWVILRVSDGTVTVELRVPWQLAAQQGQAIAQGLANMQAQAQHEATGGLILPEGPGSLLIAQRNGPPPANGRAANGGGR